MNLICVGSYLYPYRQDVEAVVVQNTLYHHCDYIRFSS